MKRQHILLPAIVISLLLLQLTFAAPPRYEVVDLGTLPGWYVSVASSINDRGDIVGSVYAGAWCRAILFDASGSGNNIDLGTLGGNLSLGPSINNNGKIVGYAKNASAFWRATLFHPSGIAIENLDLGTLGGNHSFAHSINDNGQIVGSAENSSGYERATLFDPTGHRNNIELGTLGGLESKAHSINDSGQIVGWAEIRPLSVVSHATLFDPTGSGANIDLGTLGGNQSLAFSINVSGQIVGKSRNSSGYQCATLFDSSGAGDNVDLGTLGGDWSSAEWINDKGQIVGAAAITSGYKRATLFDSTGHGNNIDLNTLIDPDCGWTLEWGSSINNNGWIVGGGINPDGENRAFLMTPVPAIIYVDDNANGNNDGSSWANAFNYLQDALTAAWSGDEIWVAQGTYKPDQGNGIIPGDRTATFQLKNGVTLKGGYAGEGTPDPNARDIQLYETILSGDLDDNDVEIENFEWETLYDFTSHPSRGENSYTIVTGNGTDSTAMLDGFTITAGHANNPDADYGSPENNGGGMYNESGSPTLINCTFHINTIQSIWNSAGTRGGGMYNSNSSPTLRHCYFIENIVFSGDVTSHGGGMFNINSHPTLTKCVFRHNVVTGFDDEYYGGGMCNYNSNPTLTDCSFIDNSAEYSRGGAMFNYDKSGPVLMGCSFQGNKAISGGAISGGKSKLTDCTFRENKASGFGGGIHAGGNSTLTNCIFIRNSAGQRGGGMCNYYNSSPMLRNCTFSENTAKYEGGGIYNTGSSPMLTNCTFSGNCTFFQKESGMGGAGMSNHSGSPMLTNCTFSGNLCSSIGGGMFNYGSSPTLSNCTFATNVAIHGNALACDSWMQGTQSNIEVTNCIFWDGGDEICNNDMSTITITYTDIQGSWPGEGNINTDPLFRDADGDDNVPGTEDDNLRLSPGSPCINAGDPNYVAEPNETDLDGRPRVIGGRIDMGAYEYRPPIPAEVRIVPRTINLASKGKWITCYISLPEDYDVADIDPNSIFLEDKIQAESLKVDEQEQVAIAKFNRSDVQDILETGDIELTITGRLTDGTVFEGTDIIKVINKAGKK